MDALSLLSTLDEDISHRVSGVHRRVNDANQSCLSELSSFVENFTYTTRIGFDADRLIRDSACTLDRPFYNEFGVPIVIPSEEQRKALFETLDVGLLPSVDDFLAKVKKDITRPLYPFGDRDVPALLAAMNKFCMTDVLEGTNKTLAEKHSAYESVGKSSQELRAKFAEAQSAEGLCGSRTH